MTSQPSSRPEQSSARGDDQEMVVIRERKKTRKRKRKKTRRVPVAVKVIVAVVAVLAIAAGAAYAFISYNIDKGEEQLHAVPELKDTAQTIKRDGHEYAYNSDVVAVLVMGKDDESAYGTTHSCTDANMLVTLDTATKELDVVVIPRDAMVDVDLYQDGVYTRTGLYQLAVAYGVDVDDEDTAARNSLKSVSTLFYNLPVNRYFVLEMDAVGQLSSAVGGVKVEALDVYPGAEFQVGDTVLLEGEAALKYVRFRDVDVDKSAQDRQKRQMQFVKAFLEKVRASDAQTILDLYNTVQNSTHTNFDFSDISYLASVFASEGNATTKFLSVTGETKLEIDDDGIEREHVYLDEDSVMDATVEAFYTMID